MMTSNGIGAGHLIRASAIARQLNSEARPIIFSMAYSVIEVAAALGLEAEFVPGRDKGLMNRRKWDRYLRDRLVALIDETCAKVVSFDGVVPYPGILSAKFLRPEVSFVWVRRGMWQQKPHGIALNLQSKLMDYVIEPGDIAREYDLGPTKNRVESVVTNPVTLYDPLNANNRRDARTRLGLDLDRPAVLVQLGVGEADLDERVFAVLRGLSKWKNLQIIMARKPPASRSGAEIMSGLDIKVVRFFPFADVLSAFDAVVCAAGYNSVHETIAARVPTLLIANNRGTDDQSARAKWCRDYKLALYADDASLTDIEQLSSQLCDEQVRNRLVLMCRRIPTFDGQEKISAILLALTNDAISSLILKRIRYQRLMAQNLLSRGFTHGARLFVNYILRMAAIAFRTLFPHKSAAISDSAVLFSASSDPATSHDLIRSNKRFEHLLLGSSSTYFNKRMTIATRAYEVSREALLQIDNGTFSSIDLSSSTISK